MEPQPILSIVHLQVWYAAHYAENMGVKTHLVSEADQEGTLTTVNVSDAQGYAIWSFQTPLALTYHILLSQLSSFASMKGADIFWHELLGNYTTLQLEIYCW